MAQVTGRKVATTPIVPTPSGGGNVINSWNTSDNKETNAPSIKIVEDKFDEINDNLTQYDMNNSQYLTDKFRFATKDGKDGYIKKVLGADTFFPFKSVGTEVTVTIDANGFFHINDANNYDIYILDITAGDNTLAEVTGHITISTITNANATLLSQEAKQYGRYYGTSLYIVERTNTGEIIITPNNTASLQALGIVKAYGY